MTPSPSILIAAKPGSDHFARPYAEALGARVLLTADAAEVRRHAPPYDVLWLEWANDLAERVLAAGPLPCRVVVRVHDHEVWAGRVDGIAWEHVDLIWFINRQAMYDFEARLPHVTTPRFFLPNAVDPAPFSLVAEDSCRLALLTVDCRPRKRIDRALRLLSLLSERYTLHIRTREGFEYGNLRTLERGLGLTGRVHWDLRTLDVGRIGDKEDVVGFFRGKSHILSTSDHEGFHYAVAEGALCGLVPVVYDWEWGRASDFWAVFTYDSLQGMATALQHQMPGGIYARYVREAFAPDVLAPRLLEHITQEVAA